MGEAIQQLGYPLDISLTILQRNLVAEVALFDSGGDQRLDIRDQCPQFLDHVIHRHQELTRFIVGLYLDRYIQIAIGQTIGHAQSLFDGGDDAFDQQGAKPGCESDADRDNHRHGYQHHVIPGLRSGIFRLGHIELQVDQLGDFVAYRVDGAIEGTVKSVQHASNHAVLGGEVFLQLANISIGRVEQGCRLG